MKNTVKTSRVAEQLEKMFRALNTRFFSGELEEVVITLKKTPGAYGHITCGKTWNAGGAERHEINISTAWLFLNNRLKSCANRLYGRFLESVGAIYEDAERAGATGVF